MCVRISLLTSLLLLAAFTEVWGQRERNIWYFGARVGLDFNSTPPVPLTNSSMAAFEGSSSIADPITGALLFYTDGITVWNRMHAEMPNGTGLLGHESSTSAALIIPLPGSKGLYYIFTSGVGSYRAGEPSTGINYSIVDMSADGGLGDVTTKNAPLLKTKSEKLCAVRGCGEFDVWVIGHGFNDSSFYAWRVSPGGIDSPVVSRVGPLEIHPGIGYMKVSPDMRKIAAAINMQHSVALLDFNPSTGVVGPLVATLGRPSGLPWVPYGVCFSLDNSKLYVSSLDMGPIIQFDISSRQQQAILTSAVEFQNGDFTAALQLGPDGKIYCASGQELSVINDPNKSGAACGLRVHAIGFGGNGSPVYGLPNVLEPGWDPSLSVGPGVAICRGDSGRLTAAGGSAYLWSPATGLDCPTCATPKASPDTSTTYRVRITNALGCTFYDTVRVVVHNPPKLTLSGRNAICAGESTRLTASGVGKIQWTPSTGLSCSTCDSPVASPDLTTLYLVTLTDSNGCQSSDTMHVWVYDSSSAEAGPDTTICRGEPLQLNGSDGEMWEWTPSLGLNCSDCRSPMAGPAVTTLYHLTVKTFGGCLAYDSILVTVIEPPIVDAGEDTAVCIGESVRLNASDGITWKWTPSLGLSCSDCRSPVATPSVTTTYTVFAGSGLRCNAIDSVKVTVLPTPKIDAGGDRDLCRGSSLRLRATGGSGYRWSSAPGLSCYDCPDPLANPDSTRTWIVSAVGSNGCIGYDTITISVFDASPVDAGPDIRLCQGDTAQLTASDGTAWLWSPAAGLSCIDCRSPRVAPAVTTRYSVEVKSAAGCSGSDSLLVVVDPLPPLRLSPNIEICEGDSTELLATSNRTVQWSPSYALSCTACSNPVASPTTTTRYIATVTDSNGCVRRDSIEVRVRPLHRLILSIPRDVRIQPGSSVSLPLLVIGSIDSMTACEFTLGYDPAMVRVNGVTNPQSAASGMTLTTIPTTPGSNKVRLQSLTPVKLRDGDTLLRINVEAYIGNRIRSELPFDVAITSPECISIARNPGSLLLDSICGLSWRLIEFSPEAYVLKGGSPNPVSTATTIRFTIGLDAPTRLEVTDMRGAHVATLIDEYLTPGEYAVRWDVSHVPIGKYFYRIQSGTWIATGTIVVQP